MSTDDIGVLVVGAGHAELATAAELARFGPVTVVERLPAPGGQAGFESGTTRQLYDEGTRRGVRFLLGSTALRWSAGRLLVVGPARTEWLRADWLVFAGGSRPATAAELGLLGGRLAGVFSATVAHHLLEAGITLGRRPLVVGGGDWADIVVPELRHAAVRITLSGGGGRGGSGEPGLRRWPGYRAIAVHGFDRVNRVTVTDGRSVRDIACDAVVLAGGLRPLRNIDGAIRDGAPRASFVQPIRSGMSQRAVVDFARTETARVRAEMGPGS